MVYRAIVNRTDRLGGPVRFVRIIWALGLFATFIVAVALRSYGLERRELSNAEAFTFKLVQYTPQNIVWLTARDVHPPLYYLVLQTWRLFFGSSVMAGRLLSTFISSIAMIGIAALVHKVANKDLAPSAVGLGAVVSVFLVGANPLQMEYGAAARMYALGLFWTVLATYVLIKATAAPQQTAARYWIAYGVLGAVFCWTHYYALFTIAAHGVFVLAYRILFSDRRSRTGQSVGRKPTRRILSGFLLAFSVMAVLYSPWLHVFLKQSREVRDTFWVEPISWDRVGEVFVQWLLGAEMAQPATVWIAVILAVLVGLALLYRPTPAKLLFFVMAVVPWLATAAVFWLTGRSLLQPRYLLFAHVGLCLLIGTMVAEIGQLPARWAVASWIIFMAGLGAWDEITHLPRESPLVVQAAQILRREARTEDVIVTEGPIDQFRIEARAKDANTTSVLFRCAASPFPTEAWIDKHQVPLADDEYFDPKWLSSASVTRMWRAGPKTELQSSFFGFTERSRFEFVNDRNERYHLVLFQRDDQYFSQ